MLNACASVRDSLSDRCMLALACSDLISPHGAGRLCGVHLSCFVCRGGRDGFSCPESGACRVCSEHCCFISLGGIDGNLALGNHPEWCWLATATVCA
eukprot:1330839-Pleurochrysis_carterae.AAC.1